MELKSILEVLLFTSQKPLSPNELRDVLSRAADEEGAEEHVKALKKTPVEEIVGALLGLAQEHETAARTYRLVCVAGAWQFVTQPEFAPWLRTFLGVKSRPARLSQPALETLAIIAYRQPITRAEIEQIRGVAVDGVMGTLKERHLVVEAGRAEVIGKPMQFATGPAFLEYFGLAGLDALPAADELRRIPVQRPDSLLTVDNHLTTAPAEPTQPELPVEIVDPSVTDGASAAVESAEPAPGTSDAEIESRPDPAPAVEPEPPAAG
jgi:segregation and condensation protein B